MIVGESGLEEINANFDATKTAMFSIQNELKATLNQIRHDLTKLGLISYHQSVNINLNRIQNLIDNQKTALMDIYLMAISGKPTSALINLGDIAEIEKKSGKPVVPSINDFTMSLGYTGNDMIIFFKIPIEEPFKIASLYRIARFPFFENMTRYHPKSNGNLAFVLKTQAIALLTPTDPCIEKYVCSINQPFTKLTPEADCLVKEFFSQNSTCHKLIDERQGKFYHRIGNQLFFSLPERALISLLCRRNGTTIRKQREIEGRGMIRIRQSCIINSNDVFVIIGSDFKLDGYIKALLNNDSARVDVNPNDFKIQTTNYTFTNYNPTTIEPTLWPTPTPSKWYIGIIIAGCN